MDCVWLIDFPEGDTIELSFIEFHLEYEYNCGYDWLEVRDGRTFESPVIERKLCSNHASKTIISNGNHLYVKFHSDYIISSTGFCIWAHKAGMSFRRSIQ